ncbi:hypothetical protein SK803_06210 [Lentzea sp. BCCO 10_0856]|uniref:Lipoprotein n=1 Tax=Lentzea miocenica TaxID=3095431 RepID=A0ABU4SV85_9PSEU|nr:hypothetical protein [Lentzea sp. BCCO 10_0856]MDX8029796.1 hypothetical protein [Lentzea sp. BCCO 10_0856]
MLGTLVLSTAACASTQEQAFEFAVADARSAVDEGRGKLEKAVTGGQGVEAADAATFGPHQVFDSRTVEGGFEVDAVYYGTGRAGSAGTYEGTAVRICVRFQIHPGRSPQIEASDTECSPALPTTIPYYGTVTRTVPLKD